MLTIDGSILEGVSIHNALLFPTSPSQLLLLIRTFRAVKLFAWPLR